MQKRCHGTLAQKRAWSRANKTSVRRSQVKQYEKAKKIAKEIFDDHVRRNPDDLTSTKRLYRQAHQKAYTDLRVSPYINYFKWAEVTRKKRADYRKKRRAVTRALSRERSAALTDGYVREILSKNSSTASRDWTQEDVEIKRADLIQKRIDREDRMAKR